MVVHAVAAEMVIGQPTFDGGGVVTEMAIVGVAVRGSSGDQALNSGSTMVTTTVIAVGCVAKPGRPAAPIGGGVIVNAAIGDLYLLP
jgi:N-methylhydantoinase B/oxoprolinase/acetone carboxylase alpha subunit